MLAQFGGLQAGSPAIQQVGNPWHYPHLSLGCIRVIFVRTIAHDRIRCGLWVPHAVIVMSNTLLPPAQWAQREFALAELGDRRRTQRLVEMASCLAQCPTGTLPQAFPDWKDLKGAYRFL